MLQSSRRAPSRPLLVLVLAATQGEDLSVATSRLPRSEHAGELALPVPEHGPPVRREHVLDREVEQRAERLLQVGVRRLAEPALGAQPERLVCRAGLAPAPSRTSPATTAAWSGNQ